VEPRPAYSGLVRTNRVPWSGRAEDKADESVWAVTCLLTRAGHRRRGVSAAMVRAAVGYARELGARALEGYPMVTTNAIAEELHVGTRDTFAEAGFVEVARPTVRRVVMRVDL
jgi:GNAT superfamily N-acetyltransferase